MSARRLAYPFRLPLHRALLAGLLPPVLALWQLWKMVQVAPAQGGEAVMPVSPWSLPLWALGAAAALLWLLWVLRFCRQGRLVLDEEALTVRRAGLSVVVPYGCIRSINLLRRAGYQWLCVEYEGESKNDVLRLPQVMLPTGKAFDKMRRNLRHMAKLARQSSLMQQSGVDASDTIAVEEDDTPASSVSGKPRRAKWRLLPWLSAWAACSAVFWWMALAWLPTAYGFDWAVREMLYQQARDATPFDERPRLPGLEQVCLQLDSRPAPDGRSAKLAGMAWHEDFIDEAARPQARKGQLSDDRSESADHDGRRLAQLRALADAGVLERARINVLAGGAYYPATRFRLSRKGWESTGWSNPPQCFGLGWHEYQGLSDWHEEPPRNNLERSYYVISMRVTLNAAQTPYWATHPAVQRAFPDQLPRLLQPETRHLILVREASGWAGLQTRERAARAESGWKYWRRELQVLYAKLSRQIALAWNALRGKDMPSQAEVRQAIEKMHGKTAAAANLQNCLNLPGHANWPVDEDLSAQPPRYGVAMYANAERAADSRIATHTLPYLQRLTTLGVLHRERRDITAQRGPKNGQSVPADIYTLSADMQSAQHPLSATCLPLGEPQLDIVSLEIAPASATSPQPLFRYHLIATYPNPPAWTQRADLQAKWPQLRDALARGRFCTGEFAYDMTRHETASGAGRCNWAYDEEGP